MWIRWLSQASKYQAFMCWCRARLTSREVDLPVSGLRTRRGQVRQNVSTPVLVVVMLMKT
jgi:hypothetical protein